MRYETQSTMPIEEKLGTLLTFGFRIFQRDSDSLQFRNDHLTVLNEEGIPIIIV